jgi:hypothetical protein
MGLFRTERKGRFAMGNHPKNGANSLGETAMKRERLKRADLYGQSRRIGPCMGTTVSYAYR